MDHLTELPIIQSEKSPSCYVIYFLGTSFPAPVIAACVKLGESLLDLLRGEVLADLGELLQA